MKPRRVIVMVEIETDEKLKDITSKVRETLWLLDYEVLQIQANVIQPKEKVKH